MKIETDRNEFYKILFIFLKEELEQNDFSDYLDDSVLDILEELKSKNILRNIKEKYQKDFDMITRNKFKFINKSFSKDNLKSIIQIESTEEKRDE